MMGLDAIAEHNGWAMALTGIIIVMCGLSVLALILSQMHKVIGLFEQRKASIHFSRSSASIDVLNDLPAAALLYKPLTAELGDSFHLAQLYRIFEKEKLPHPHLTIRALRSAGYLQPIKDGLFRWKED